LHHNIVFFIRNSAIIFRE